MRWITRFTTYGLLTFVAASLVMAVADVAQIGQTAPSAATSLGSEATDNGVEAFYFHTNTRCPTCRTIEAKAQEALADAVQERRIRWHVVNYQEPANRHFAQAFKLEFASLVLVKREAGTVTRWKNLDRVWELYSDPPAFAAYVRQELQAFQEGTP